MVRKTSLALVIATVLSPLSAHALGLGDIHLKSALNQQLRADIDLLSVKSGELDTVKIELAGQESFQRAGVDRTYLLTLLRFRPVRRPDGSAIIEVTTRDAVREPFLNFLIEVNWPQGKLVREYTLLLDPPATLARRPPPVSAPVAKAPAALPAGAGVAESVTPQMAASATPGEYGPTQRNETLWVIADKLRPGGVSIAQMMIALQQANPDAFYKDNVNYLKRGVILRVPGSDSLEALSRSEARAEFAEQTARWEADRSARSTQPAAAPAEAPVEAAEPVAAAPEAKPSAPEAELQIVAAPAQGAAGAVAAGEPKEAVEKLKNDLLLAREANESARQEAAELESRVKDLEAQLVDMRTLVSLKDDQLAQLQATLAGGVAEPEAEAAPAMAGAPAEVGASETMPTTEGEPAATAAPAPGSQAEVAATAMPAEGPMTAETPVASPEGQPQAGAGTEAERPAAAGTEEAAAQPAPAEMPAPVATEEETVVPEAPSPMTAEPSAAPPPAEETPEPATAAAQPKDQSSAMYWILGGLGGVLALGLGVAAVRRREAKAAHSDESILIDLEDKSAESSQLLASSGESDSQTDETSFLSDFSPSDIDALQDETGEVDPVSEADVYMAYNRYQQAEELLRQAVAKEPGRADLRFKLLEVLVAGQSVDAFLAEAENVSREGLATEHPSEWTKVVALGRDLAPEHPLFTQAAGEASGAPAAEETAVIQGAGEPRTDAFTEFDLGDLESELEMASAKMATSPETEADETERGSVEFGDSVFDFVNEERPEGQAPSSGDVEIESSSDFIAESEPALGETERADMEFDLGDFADLDQSPDDGSGQPAFGLRAAPEPHEFDRSATDMGSSLGDQDVDFDRMESIPGEDSISLEGLDSAMSDLEASEDLALDETPSTVEVAEEPTMGLGEAAPDDDEVATKLDLARAYIDMGDEEGARSILDEVLSEGSEAQQSEAKGLMQRLA